MEKMSTVLRLFLSTRSKIDQCPQQEDEGDGGKRTYYHTHTNIYMHIHICTCLHTKVCLPAWVAVELRICFKAAAVK